MKENTILQVAKPMTSPHRILVAEDDHDVRRLNTEVLIDSGYHVDAAQDGAVAWDILQIKSYDLLITDYDMPKLSGLELVKKARAARMALPVILVSGKMPMEMLREHSWLQINATLPKPYDIMELLDTVKEVLCANGDTRG
ncbi:MAG: response regulator [Verrucomicrobiota bacterium]|jgi:DNA-binding response OmpR family regulator